MSDSDHLNRILQEAGAEGLTEILSQRLSPTDLQTLLLEVYRLRAASVTPAKLLERYRDNRFVKPSPIDPRVFLEFDQVAFEVAEHFTPVELAPLAPLATVSAVTTVSQNNAVATSRNTEIVSDSTNLLALECATRRRSGEERVKLCASHRLTRPQFIDQPNAWAHFRLFALCTAGRDQGSYSFETKALLEHLDIYLRLLNRLKDVGYGIGRTRVAITDFSATRIEVIQRQVIGSLQAHHPETQIEFYPDRSTGRGYYDQVCFHIYVTGLDGTEYFLVDGGFTQWTQQLLANKKERLLTSGVGTERLCAVLRP